MLLLGIVSSAILFLVSRLIPWESILHIHNSTEFRLSTSIFSILFGLYLFSNSIKKIFQGLQRAYLGHFVSSVANLSAVIALFVAAKQHAGIPLLVFINFGLSSIFPISLLILLIKEGHVQFLGSIAMVGRESKLLMGTGSLFFLIQVGVLINSTSESTLIAAVLGPAAVAVYAVALRPFQYCSLPIRMFGAPLWSSYADAYARNDRAFIRRTFRFHLTLAVLLGGAAVILMGLAHRSLVSLWTSHRVEVPVSLTMALVAWAFVDVLSVPLSVYMNGCGKIKAQAYSTLFSIICFLPLKIISLKLFGTPGMVWSSVVFLIFITVIFYLIIFRTQIFEPLTSLKVREVVSA